MTSLPNLHPALVHFPIALLPTAVACDLVGLTETGRRRGARELGVVLWVAAALSAGLAQWAGEVAGDSLVDVPVQAQAALGEHSDWGHYTWWLVGSLAFLRVALAWWQRGETPRPSWPVALLALFGLGGVGMTLYTADLGGALVYRHGLGVSIPDRPESTSPDELDSENGERSFVSRLTERDGGGWTWAPLPGDTDALGAVLRAPKGATLDSLVATRPEMEEQRGLVFEIDGDALLVFPGEFGDVQVSVELELLDFEGRVGLAHHVRSAGEAGLFALDAPSGEFTLVTLRENAPAKLLDEASGEIPARAFRLSVSAAGRHLRGTLDGTLVAHGHEPPLPSGGCGLFFDGRGRVRVLRVDVEPVAH